MKTSSFGFITPVGASRFSLYVDSKFKSVITIDWYWITY